MCETREYEYRQILPVFLNCVMFSLLFAKIGVILSQDIF